MGFAPSARGRWNTTGWTRLHRQVCALMETASTDVDYFVAIQRRFGGDEPPGVWEAIPTDHRSPLDDVLDALRVPSTVCALGVVTWATVRRVTSGGFDETPGWIAIVTTDAGLALSAAVTVDSDVLWTPYPSGPLAQRCQVAFTSPERATKTEFLDRRPTRP